MLAGLPDVEIRADQAQSHRQPVPADGLGKADHVGFQVHVFKTEEGSGAAAPGLDVIDDVVFPAQSLQSFQPLPAGGVQPAFRLNRLDDGGGGQVHTAASALEHAVDIFDGVYLLAKVTVVGHAGGIGKGQAGAFPLEHIA